MIALSFDRLRARCRKLGAESAGRGGSYTGEREGAFCFWWPHSFQAGGRASERASKQPNVREKQTTCCALSRINTTLHDARTGKRNNELDSKRNTPVRRSSVARAPGPTASRARALPETQAQVTLIYPFKEIASAARVQSKRKAYFWFLARSLTSKQAAG